MLAIAGCEAASNARHQRAQIYLDSKGSAAANRVWAALLTNLPHATTPVLRELCVAYFITMFATHSQESSCHSSLQHHGRPVNHQMQTG